MLRVLVLLGALLGAAAFAPAPRAGAKAALRASTLDERPATLAWDDKAKWLEQCNAGGVVSWYDAGLRLTAPAAAELSLIHI